MDGTDMVRTCRLGGFMIFQRALHWGTLPYRVIEFNRIRSSAFHQTVSIVALEITRVVAVMTIQPHLLTRISRNTRWSGAVAINIVFVIAMMIINPNRIPRPVNQP